MIGMGSDKKIGTLLLAIGGGLKPKEESDPYADIVNICAERVLEAIKMGDAKMLIKELPKLMSVLPSPEFEAEEGEEEED